MLVLVALTRFKRILKRARPVVRNLTHTLHVPPAQPELYDGPQEGWLRDILDRLPCLQALIVSNLSFFDHQSLLAVHRENGQLYAPLATYGLRLLIASYCENTTATSLALALLHFPTLVYLDISSTQGARNSNVLRCIGSLSQLRVLKLRHCGLRDDDVESLTLDSLARIQSIDISHNFLTEKGIVNLVGGIPGLNLPLRWYDNTLCNEYNSLRRPSTADVSTMNLLKILEGHVAPSLLGDELKSLLFLESDSPSRFSHLYIASNNLSISSLMKLLQYPKLQTLDCGSLNWYKSSDELLSPTLYHRERLNPHTFARAFKNVTSLRLHHAIVTDNPFEDPSTAPDDCIPDMRGGIGVNTDATLAAVNGPYELETISHIAELPGDFPRFELSAEPSTAVPTLLRIKNNPKIDLSQDATVSSELPEQNTDQLLTPILPSKRRTVTGSPSDASTGGQIVDGFPTANQLGRGIAHVQEQGQRYDQDAASNVPEQPPSFSPRSSISPVSGTQTPLRPNTIDLLERVEKRRSYIAGRERNSGRFNPSLLTGLETIILTDIPATTRKPKLLEALKILLQELAEEEQLRILREMVEHPHDISGMANTGDPAVKRLVLEMSNMPEIVTPPHSPRSPRAKRESFTKSSTEDPDSEMFMEASEMDFTFFGEDDGGLLVSEGRLDSLRINDDGMIFHDPGSSHATELGHAIDVVAELSAFRKAKRAAYEYALKSGRSRFDMALLGHWTGEVKVIRPQ
ncbi:hypothetical protein BP5796_03105 [Coleophoma crateriformis]|uniref:RNI-like protein n=1 Tax=Coleophoma crateriformis TaxID=565419 RepID=A0A3D8SMJ8_9HELO|nr:hypothetical protein BP5796_03105 [Coleophoma crateriformis]